jgi:TolB-like protein
MEARRRSSGECGGRHIDADAGDIRDQLVRILESANFKATPKRREMLRYVVEETLAGRSDAIKGYTIGVNVFGRGDGFDPNADPVVRLEARRLRHDLDSYYVAEGRDDPLRIMIPTGQYVPEVIRQDTFTRSDIVDGVQEPPDTDDGCLQPSRRPSWILGACLAVAAVLAFGFGVAERSASVGPASPDAPDLVVLPFETLSVRGEEHYLAASISSRLLSDLSRFPDIGIFAAQAGFAQNPSTDPLELGKRLGVSFVLAGDVRSDASTISIGVRLIDATTGEIVWAQSYDRVSDPDTISRTENEIAADIASALGQPYGVIRTTLTDRLSDGALQQRSSYECVLRAYHFRRTYATALFEPVMSCMQAAVEKDPGYAEAWSMLGFMHYISEAIGFGAAEPGAGFAAAEASAQQALDLAPDNVMALKVLSAVRFYQGRFDDSERYVRAALAANPNDPDTLYQAGWRMAIRGNFDEGIPMLEEAVRRTVNPPGPYFHLLAIDRLMKGDGEGMLTFARQAAADGSALSYSMVAMAYGLLDEPAYAEAAIERMNEGVPGYDPIARLRAHQATEDIIEAATAALSATGLN